MENEVKLPWNDSPVSALSRITHAGAAECTQPREWAGDMNNMAIPPLGIKISTCQL
jgi:hypothetical protein